MFDIFVGTSVGSAMAAGFAKNYEAEHLERGTHEIFVKSPQLPAADLAALRAIGSQGVRRALADQYGRSCRIEDCWRPFAAVATNLSTHNLELIRTGLLWQAVRASSAIPGLLPPFYTSDGAMLVDGCLVDNVPLVPMHQLKSGPNLVVHFGDPATEMFDVDYAALPGRLELLASMLLPFRKKMLPEAPSAVNVLWRSLVAHQRYDTLPTTPLDLVMRAADPARRRRDRFRPPRGNLPRQLSLGPRGHHGAGGGGQSGDRGDPRHRRSPQQDGRPIRGCLVRRGVQLNLGTRRLECTIPSPRSMAKDARSA